MQAGSTIASGLELSPEYLRRFLAARIARWADVDYPKPAGWSPVDWATRLQRSQAEAVAERVVDNLEGDDSARAQAREALEPIIARGLLRREGRFVWPFLVLDAESARDGVAWEWLCAAYALHGGDVADVECTRWGQTFTLLVCEACTAVFPKRVKRTARFCPLCANDPAAGSLFASTLSMPPAVGAKVRVPKIDPQMHGVVAWRSLWVSRCVECRKPMLAGRLDAKTHSRCASKHRRRIR